MSTDPQDFENEDDYQAALIEERQLAYHGGIDYLMAIANGKGRERRLDRWMEAVYGARLRLHASPEANANEPPSYWQRVYKRWSQLYHQEHPI